MIYEKTMGQAPLGPLLGKQNIQAKEVYFSSIFLVSKADISCKSKHGI